MSVHFDASNYLLKTLLMYAIVCLISQSIYVVNISVQGIQDNIDTNIS
jgi:hypothetical protein